MGERDYLISWGGGGNPDIFASASGWALVYGTGASCFTSGTRMHTLLCARLEMPILKAISCAQVGLWTQGLPGGARDVLRAGRESRCAWRGVGDWGQALPLLP